MAKDWSYAKLAKWASENGGPERALDMIKKYYLEKGRQQGAASKNHVIAAAGIIGTALGAGSAWAYSKYKQKKKMTIESEDAEIKKAEANLIAGMEAAAKDETAEEKICHHNEEQSGNERVLNSDEHDLKGRSM